MLGRNGITNFIEQLRSFRQKFRNYLYSCNAPEEEIDYTKDRQFVGNIIISVLTERIDVKKGLLLFPKGCEDPSIHASWHALCHYEADEDIKKQDTEFNNQQVELLEMIAYEFKDGNPLPQNIIEAYEPYYKDNPVSYQKGLKGLLKKFVRFLNI